MNFHQALDSSASLGLFLELLDDHLRVQMVLVNEKVIRALRLHVPGSKRGFREILEIESNDGLSVVFEIICRRYFVVICRKHLILPALTYPEKLGLAPTGKICKS
jgi:hypothetical protein